MHEMHFVCSFFSAARRTNQEAPPRLSGFWLVATVAVGVCGTRFARIVLALFPPSSLRLHRPIKAESGDLACILTPSPCGHSPYIPCRNTGEKGNTRFGNEVEFYCFVTPRHVTGHGRGRRLNTNDFLSPPKIVSDARDALRLFILLSSEKNELRSSGSYRAIRLVATVAVGVCGTRSARTVLALFPPSSLRLHRPIKAGI